MRNFWIAMGVLALIAVVVIWRSEGASSNPRNSNAVLTNIVGDQPAAPAAIAPSVGQKHAPPAPAAASPIAPAPAPAPMTLAAAPAPAAATPAPIEQPRTDAQTLVDDLGNNAGDKQQGDAVADALDDGSVPASDHAAASGGHAPATVDGKLIVSGDGSMESPYEITWDALILASQTYQPRLGKTELPEQVSALDGKQIKIAGYFAVPIASQDPKEVLFMLNMWDGCCIGVPPSPYDAIEVKLKQPLGDGRKQYVNYGTLTGTLKVDPYVQNGWLLGMYVMEDGTLEAGM